MIRINNTQYFHFLQQADALRREGSLCDAIISVKSHTFRAHRLVLACASGRLARQLAQGDADKPAHCTLELFSPRTFQQVLDFTYAQALEVSADDLCLLLRAAQLLEMWPLEEQCRKQLDSLPRQAREEEPRGAVRGEEEGREGATDGRSTGSSMQGEEEEEEEEEEETVQVKTERASDGIITENRSSPRSVGNHKTSPPPRKKSRLSPLSSVPDSRESKSSRPNTSSTSSSSSSSPPWTFSTNTWSSVSTLRRIAENYSNFFTAQSSHQPPVMYPLSLYAPFLSSHFQNRVMMDHSSFYPERAQSIYPAASAGISSILKQGLLRRRRPSQRVFGQAVQSTKQSYPEVSKSSTESDKDSQQHRTRQPGDSAQHDSASTASGDACAGCHFCGRGDAVQHEAPPSQREHRAEKPYQCQHCPKRFSLKHQLDTHHRVHTGEKPFECRLCGQRSRDYSAMIKHLRTHNGATPYQCTLCLEFCSSLVAMHRHVKSHDVQDFPPDWKISSTYLYTSHV